MLESPQMYRAVLAESRKVPVVGTVVAVIRYVTLCVRSVVLLPLGVLQYRRTGRTPQSAHQAMIWLFCATGGRMNDAVSRLIARRRPKVPLPKPVGVLGDLSESRGRMVVEKIRADGYAVFASVLGRETCDRLLEFAMRTPAVVRPMDNEATPPAPQTARFNPDRPLAVRYDYNPSDLLKNADVQALLADPTILAVAQEYLDCEPSADVLSMWWHTNFQDRPDAGAAQFFHFDMDRMKWLKIFIYLTDVAPDNGPHVFVRGSHRTGAIPNRFLYRGYQRINDDEVAAAYPKDDLLEFSAPRGTIILEDTRGLHKGAHVRGAPRLILQLQFSNSLFGTNYPPARLTEVIAPSLKALMATAPSIYRQYAS